MNIIFIAPECFPFACASSLSDLVLSLAKGVEKLGHNIKVFVPRYGCIDPLAFHIERLPLEFKVNFRKPNTPTFVYKGILPNSLVNIFFIESQNHFCNSKEIYSSGDEERFTFFSLATLEVISKLKFDADIIHLFNPHTAYIARFLRSNDITYLPWNTILGLVFTTVDLSQHGEHFLQATKEAINYSDLVTVASKAYANELLSDTSSISTGLTESLIRKKDSFIGTSSSIDEDTYNPQVDNAIAQNYSKSYFSLGKRKCKEDLLEETGLEKNIHTPLFGIVCRLSNEEGIDILTSILPQIASLNLQLVILGKGIKEHEEELTRVASRYRNIRVYLTDDNNLAKKIYSSTDFLLRCSKQEPSGIPILIAMKYGSVPIAYNTGAIKDIVIDADLSEFANGITFNNYKKEDLLEAINKAIRLYKNKERWPKLVKQAMGVSFDNLSAAKEYISHYERILNPLVPTLL